MLCLGSEVKPCAAFSQGIKERDQVVFQKCRTRDIPIVMVTSGGYQRSTARIIADSILNLYTLALIKCEEAENAPPPESEELNLLNISQVIYGCQSRGRLWSEKLQWLLQCDFFFTEMLTLNYQIP